MNLGSVPKNIPKNIKKENELKHELAGTAYEEISECYEDILGAINYVLENKYDEIYLMGHSLGSTKSVYFYNKLLNENNELISKINNTNLNIGYIKGADHSYTGKEEILADEILKFVGRVLEKDEKLWCIKGDEF